MHRTMPPDGSGGGAACSGSKRAGHRGEQRAQSSDEEGGPSGDEETDNAAEPEEFPVNCACGEASEAASGDWILCDCCKTWKHSYCEALTESDLSDLADRLFECGKCEEARGTASAASAKAQKPKPAKGRHGTSRRSRPCTSFCTGCKNAGGCEAGMGPLTHSCRERIVQFTLNLVAAQEVRMAERRVGEMVLVSQGAGKNRKKRAMVLKWTVNEVALVYESDMGPKAALGTAESKATSVAAVRVYRTPPSLSDDELEEAASRLGCTREPPFRKQLRFEMRKALVLLLKHKHIERDPRERTADMYRVVRLRL